MASIRLVFTFLVLISPGTAQLQNVPHYEELIAMSEARLHQRYINNYTYPTIDLRSVFKTNGYLDFQQGRTFGKYSENPLLGNLRNIWPIDICSSLHPSISKKCCTDIEIILTSLLANEWWAEKMIDSFGKLPGGLIEGDVFFPGAYDECLDLEAVHEYSSAGVRRRHKWFDTNYCQIGIHIPQLTRPWNAKGLLTIGFCVPDSCAASDIKYVYNKVTSIIPFWTGGEQNVFACHEEQKYDAQAIIPIIVCVFIASLLIIGTIYDVTTLQRSKIRKPIVSTKKRLRKPENIEMTIVHLMPNPNVNTAGMSDKKQAPNPNEKRAEKNPVEQIPSSEIRTAENTNTKQTSNSNVETAEKSTKRQAPTPNVDTTEKSIVKQTTNPIVETAEKSTKRQAPIPNVDTTEKTIIKQTTNPIVETAEKSTKRQAPIPKVDMTEKSIVKQTTNPIVETAEKSTKRQAPIANVDTTGETNIKQTTNPNEGTSGKHTKRQAPVPNVDTTAKTNLKKTPNPNTKTTEITNEIQTPKPNMDTTEKGNIEKTADSNVDTKKAVPIQPTREPGQLGKFLLCFSVYQNASKLLNTDLSKDNLAPVHGIRFFSMTWIILGHTYFFGALVWKNNNTFVRNMQTFSFQAVGNALVSVDSFFLLSGMLVVYVGLKAMEKGFGIKDWLYFYFHRFWRLTPTYMLVMMVYITLMKYWGNGPYWPNNGTEENYCRHNWWQNLLYINNLFDKQCMGWMWYLANDMQFFVFSPFILILLKKIPIGGLIAIFLLLGGQSTLTAFAWLRKERNPVIGVDREIYVMPYTRVGPYLVGMIYGYALYRIKGKIAINRFLSVFLWLVASACAASALYGLYGNYHGDVMTKEVAATYWAVHRNVWAVAVGWVIFACVTGHGGVVNSLLSYAPFVPLSRLSYVVYLINPIVIMTYCFQQRFPVYVTNFLAAHIYLSHVCLCYIFAFVVSLAFEAPIIALEKFFRNIKHKITITS